MCQGTTEQLKSCLDTTCNLQWNFASGSKNKSKNPTVLLSANTSTGAPARFGPLLARDVLQ
jgi:hypothetical protein